MKYTPPHTTHYSRLFKRLIIGGALLGVLFVGSLMAYSQIAHANIFSFISSVLQSDHASAQTVVSPSSVLNSQTISLPEAAANINPTSAHLADIPPIQGDILMADIAANNTDDEPVNTQISTYVVRDGDTLSSIAHMFGVSVNTVMWSNDITRASSVRVGQTLIILPVSGITYTVKKGDTLASIAAKYKNDAASQQEIVQEIVQYNDLADSASLSAGDTVIIPYAEAPTKIATRIVFKDNPAHDTDGPDYVGYYIRPIVGGVKTQGLHGYNAVDLAAPIGTPIYASAAGTVILAKSNGAWNGGYGNYVIISHPNGTQTLYAHASKILVSAGQQVAQGEMIAKIGVTGETTGPHVHFEIRGAKNPF